MLTVWSHTMRCRWFFSCDKPREDRTRCKFFKVLNCCLQVASQYPRLQAVAPQLAALSCCLALKPACRCLPASATWSPSDNADFLSDRILVLQWEDELASPVKKTRPSLRKPAEPLPDLAPLSPQVLPGSSAGFSCLCS